MVTLVALSARGWGLLLEEKETVAFLDQCRTGRGL